MLRLYVTPFSPRSEMAKWALDAQGIPYETAGSLPVVGSPDLRLRARRLRGALSGPIAVKDGETCVGPLEVARFGARRSLTPIVPVAHLPAIARWADRADRMLRAGRLLALDRVRSDDAALRDLVPPAAPLRRVAPALGRGGATLWLRRAQAADLEVAAPRERLTADLDRIREAVNASDDGYLVGGAFSFADIAIACALELVEPVGGRFARLGDGARRAWRDPALADAYADLLSWRDRTFERHREVRAPRPAPTPEPAVAEAR